MLRISSPVLRVVLIGLLVAGTMIRPLLIFACEIHAVAYSHSSQPHVHQHEHSATSDPTADAGGHGLHDLLNEATAGSAAAAVPPFVIATLDFGSEPVPMFRATPCIERRFGAPFRPPIV